MLLSQGIRGVPFHSVQLYQCVVRRGVRRNSHGSSYPVSRLGKGHIEQSYLISEATLSDETWYSRVNVPAIHRKTFVRSQNLAPRVYWRGLLTSVARPISYAEYAFPVEGLVPQTSRAWASSATEAVAIDSRHHTSDGKYTTGSSELLSECKNQCTTEVRANSEVAGGESALINTSNELLIDGYAHEESLAEYEGESVQAAALDAAFQLEDGETRDWNNKQLCKISHRNLLLYAYNHLDMATVVKITNQVLAAYQTLPRRKKASQRKQYVQKFLRCIRKHKPQEDHPQLAKWMLRCIDLLTCHDLYSMLRVRHILNYDNSFETFRASFGIENFETFSNVRSTKEQQSKIMEEKALKSKTAQRNLLMKHLKINKFRFMRDHNVTKAVYEANIEWYDAEVEAAELAVERFAFVYNLPFIDHVELKEALKEVLTRFSKVRNIEIFADRMPPLTTMVKRASIPKNSTAPPRDKYSPLYALVEFESKEDRDYICDEHIRVFGLLCCGRVVYPELAERKHSILVALYPPFKRITEALQFIANSLTEQPSEEQHSTSHDGDDGNTDGYSRETAISQCKIMTSSKRRNAMAGQAVVTADSNCGSAQMDRQASQQITPDNHVDSSMLEKIRNKNENTPVMDPQWIVLRFEDFKHAYFARMKLMRKLADDPRSLVSFDTKRSIFHNGKYMDLPLFQYSTRTENDPAVARIAQTSVDECGGYRSLGVE